MWHGIRTPNDCIRNPTASLSATESAAAVKKVRRHEPREGPDRNGIAFSGEPGENSRLVNVLLNEMLEANAPFDLESRRRLGGVSLSGSPSPGWRLEFDGQRERPAAAVIS